MRDRGVELHSLAHTPRHLTGRALWRGEEWFLKIASSAETGRALRNEVAWNRCLAGRRIPGIEIPQVALAGRVGELPFFLSTWYDVAPVFDLRTGRDPRVLRRSLPVIACGLAALSRTRCNPLTWDRPYRRVVSPARRFFRRSRWYRAQVDLPELDSMVELASEVTNHYQPGLSHGDVTPWHMYPRGDRVGLVDAEMSATLLPRFYDVAFFYQRVFTCAKYPDLARLFVAEFVRYLTPPERRQFERSFRALCAERVLGSYWDESQGGRTFSSSRLAYPRRFRMSVERNDLW